MKVFSKFALRQIKIVNRERERERGGGGERERERERGEKREREGGERGRVIKTI